MPLLHARSLISVDTHNVPPVRGARADWKLRTMWHCWCVVNARQQEAPGVARVRSLEPHIAGWSSGI